MTKIVNDFEESVKKYPPIKMGTPDPYQPPSEETEPLTAATGDAVQRLWNGEQRWLTDRRQPGG